MKSKGVFRLPQRELRAGDVLTEQDIQALLKQQSGLKTRSVRAAQRACLVRLAHDMLLEMAGGGERGDHTTIVQKLVTAFNVSERQIHADLKRHPSGDVEELKRAGWQAQTVR